MGGKHKQAQRTKDNAKPSSSGRSAALLTNTTSTFAGFSGVKDCGYVPILPCFPVTRPDDFDSSIDTNFQLVLKKMNKKDSTTRLKALQEFSRLVESSELDAVKAVLPFWPRLYCFLAEDIEHRVREAAHHAHRTIVVRAKRNVAPHLRQLAGPWFTAQFDTYPPAASAAARAFQDAFPPKKLAEAIVFCQEEILNYVCDNLLSQGVPSTATSKNMSVEKARAKQQRAVVSCLQGYAQLLRSVPAEHLVALQALPDHQRLLGSTRFWELASDAAPQIRSAWLTALVAIFERAPELVGERGPQVGRAVLGRLDEEDASVLPRVWEAALHVLTKVKDCWTGPSVDELVLPPLWRVLQEAGFGNASAIFPSLLPLLSRLPQAQGPGRAAFCSSFFGNMRQGFDQKCVVQSPGECEAVASCYVECLRYMVSTSLMEDQELACQLIEQHLVSALELTLTDVRLRLLSVPLFEHTTMLIHHWSRQQDLLTNTKLLKRFWDALTGVYMELLSNKHKSSSLNTIHQQVDLCICLKSTGRRKRKRVLKVRFHDSSSEEASPTENQHPLEFPPGLGVEFHNQLEEFVSRVCVQYLEEIKQLHCLEYVVPLSRLAAVFNSHELFLKLASPGSLAELFDGTLGVWLREEHVNVESVVELAFTLMQYLPDSDKEHVLNTMCQEASSPVLMWSLRAARARHNDPYLQQWLRGPQLSPILVLLARLIHTEPDSSHAKLAQTMLKDSLARNADGAVSISGEALEAVLSELCSGVASCADFVGDLLVELCIGGLEPSQVQSASNLVLAMFTTGCVHDTNAAWRRGLTALARALAADIEALRQLVARFSEVVKKKLLAREIIAVFDVERLARTSAILVDCASSGRREVAAVLCVVFLDGIRPELGARENKLVAVCLDSEQLTGSLNCNESLETSSSLPAVEVARYVALAAFCARLAARVLSGTSAENELHQQSDVEEETFDLQMYTSQKSVTNQKNETLIEEIGMSLRSTIINTDALDVKTTGRTTTSDEKKVESPLESDVKTIDQTHASLDNKSIENTGDLDEKITEQTVTISVNADVDILDKASVEVSAGESDELASELDVQSAEFTTTSSAISPAHNTTESHSKSTAERIDAPESCVTSDELAGDGTTEVEEPTLDIASLQTLECHILNTVCSVALCKIFEKHYQSTVHYSRMWDHLTVLQHSHHSVMSALGTTGRAHLAEAALHRATQTNSIWVWVWTRYLLCTDPGAAYAEVAKVVGDRQAAQVLVSLCGVLGCPTPSTMLRDSTCLASWACWLELLPLPVPARDADAAVALLSTWPQADSADLLYDCDVSLEPWSRVSQTMDMLHLLAACISKCPEQLPQRLWDFALVSCAYYALSLHQTQNCLSEPGPARFTIGACQLVAKLATLFGQVSRGKEEPGSRMQVLAAEWSAVFADDVHRALLDKFFELAGREREETSLRAHLVLESLGTALASLDTEYFTRQDEASRHKLLELCCQLIHSPVVPLQITAYNLLKKQLARVVAQDTITVGTEGLEASAENAAGETSGLEVQPLLAGLQRTQAVVEAMLAEFRFGDSCSVQPYTDSYAYTMAFLLLWDVLLEMCGMAGSELRYQYAVVLRDSGCLNGLLQGVFQLVPAEVVESPAHRVKSAIVLNMFAGPPRMDFSKSCSSRQLQHLACWVYYSVLRRLPALVRQWWGDTKPRVNALVQRATLEYVTPLLCSRELQSIQSHDTRFKNMEVKVHARAREVVAVYAVDEARMELVITLPEVYPLGVVHVGSQASLAPTSQWRGWVKQLSIFLTHQNGSLWDGLLLWKSNLDKRFEGVEECYICFSILHGTNFQIPKLCCKTCKKKFHSPCLYKWFSTSNKSTCPICRNMF